MYLYESFIIALSMYSKIPVPRVDWNEKNMKYAICFFPVVGVVAGMLEMGIGRLLLQAGAGSLLFAAVMTLLPVLVTGGIHMDGFMDTLDALGSYGGREKKLEILKDPHAGAFAVLGLGCYLLWSVAVWSEADADMLPVIGCSYVISRAFSGFSVVTFKAARDSGLARTFQDGAVRKTVGIVMLIVLLSSVVLSLRLDVRMGAASAAAGLLSFCCYKAVCYRQFGGMTGDLAGYFLQICELAMLTGIVLAGRLL